MKKSVKVQSAEEFNQVMDHFKSLGYKASMNPASGISVKVILLNTESKRMTYEYLEGNYPGYDKCSIGEALGIGGLSEVERLEQGELKQFLDEEKDIVDLKGLDWPSYKAGFLACYCRLVSTNTEKKNKES